MSQRICSILDCDKPVHANGMCQTHGNNLHRYGHAEPVRDWPVIARLTAVGWDVNERGCWIWRGARSEKGYGLIALRRRTGGAEQQRVHRLMWSMHNGPIDDGQVVRHRCDNPPCVNPDHLELGAPADNSQDMVERERSLAYSTGRYDGVCVSGRHDVTKPGALRLMGAKAKKYMGCVECNRERQQRYQQRKRSA